MANQDIRAAFSKARKEGIFQWQVCDLLEVSEVTMCRWLRKEMPEEKKAQIYEAIELLRTKNLA